MNAGNHVPALGALVLAMTLLAGCDDRTAPAESQAPPRAAAPAPEGVPANDPAVRRHERAAPPELQALVSGRFQPRGERAAAATGAIEIGDDSIVPVEGATLATERIAIVRGDDQYRSGERYSSLLMVGAEQPVELRRVHLGAGEGRTADTGERPAVAGTPADSTPDGPDETDGTDAGDDAAARSALCEDGKADFIALVSLNEGERRVVRMAALRGGTMPAAGATDITPCGVLEYESAP